MNAATRQALREAISAAVRERAITADYCPHCLVEMPADRGPLQTFCSKNCANNAYQDRKRGRVVT